MARTAATGASVRGPCAGGAGSNEARGIEARRAEKDLDSGITFVRQWLKADADGRPELLIADICRNTIQELLGYQEDHVGTAAATDYCADALRYCHGVRGRQSRIQLRNDRRRAAMRR